MKTCFRLYIAILTTVFFLFPIPSLFAQGDGTALQFNGSNYVQLPKTSQWDLGQSSFTLAAWFKTSMSGGYGNIIRYDGPTSGSLYLVRINSGNQIEFLIADGARASVAVATPLTYTDDQWHHVAAVRDSANDIMKIVIDGNLVTSVAGQGKNIIGSSDANLAIGATSWGVEYFAGSIDEVSIWNVARTETEIRETMFHQLTGNEIGLIGNWRFDEGTGTTASDISSNHNTGTLINGPLWVPSTPSGSGTSGDPYLIATFDNLNWIAQDAARWSMAYKQTADIDAATSSSWDGGAGFSPIGDATTAFNGSYDGQTYRITHLFINRGTTDNIGLFGYVSGATITNVKLDSVKITGNNTVGGLIGTQWNNSTVANCKSAGSVTGAGNNVGGLIGNQYNGSTARNCRNAGCVTGNINVGGLIGVEYLSIDSTCYSIGSITGNTNVGGLIGNQIYSSATNCYSTDTVKGSAQNAGGLIAYQSSSTATNCYSAGPVTGTGSVGGLIGTQENTSTAANCFWDTTSSGQTSSAGGTGKSTVEMKNYLMFSVRGWPLKGINGTIWNIGNGRNNGYPYFDWQYPGDPAIAAPDQPSGSGTSGSPYLIATLSNLNWIIQDAARWSMVYKQTATIDATTSSSLNGGAGFSPIGDGTTAFTGSYDGQTYKITDLFISRSGNDNIGLFGLVSGAVIKNVKLESVHITGNNNVGGLIGTQQSTSTATNCTSSGSVKGSGQYVGGLIGIQQNTSTATNCTSSGSVKGSGQYVGGLIGTQQNTSTAMNCTSSDTVTGAGYVGGLIGCQNNGATDSTCYSSGTVMGSGQFIGGLIGQQNSSAAVNCYSTDSVKGDSYVGGLIGDQENSTATNCYSAGLVTSANYMGGFIGYKNGSSTATNCFWDTTSSGQKISAGGTGKSTKEMKNFLTFTGWSFKGIAVDSLWNMGHGRNNGYPYLNWQYPNDSIATGVSANSQELVPRELTLKQNYPNPFNPTTTIEFAVPEDGRATLKIFDILGREVRIVYDGDVKAGYLQKVVFDASRLSSGVYFSRLQYGGKSLLKKLILLK